MTVKDRVRVIALCTRATGISVKLLDGTILVNLVFVSLNLARIYLFNWHRFTIGKKKLELKPGEKPVERVTVLHNRETNLKLES